MNDRQICERHADEISDKLADIIGVEFDFQICWDLTAKTIAGQACMQFGQYKVRLSPVYLAAVGVDKYLATVAHEICHIANFVWERKVMNGDYRGKGIWSGHGRQWKSLMVAVGYPPERCIDLTAAQREVVAPVRQAKLTATCGCPGHVHEFFRKPKYEIHRYKCKKCMRNLREMP